jgi:hypothetical protein
VREARLTRNALQPRADDDVLLFQLATFIRELGRYPTVAEMRMRKRQNDAFPNYRVLERRGSRQELLTQVATLCKRLGERLGGWDDVLNICQRRLSEEAPEPVVRADDGDKLEPGYVYLALMRVGREKHYKIGKVNLVEQGARQIAVNLPEELKLIHVITTDDAYGIERYWHRRFAEKRRGDEWFTLSADDVRAFKRRKFQ